MKEIYKRAKALFSQMQKDRRWLHAHAETGFDLRETRAYVAHRLESMGYQPKECGRAGLVATIGEENKGVAFLLRADMDALPIKERTGLSYAAKNGNMHACGHDFHAAMLLGAAQLLKNFEAELSAPIKLVFQPAEETLEGAKNMIAAGVLRAPDVGGGMMLHVLTNLPLKSGTVIVSSGGISAPAADFFTITLKGKSCHGSSPQGGRDALNAAAHLLVSLQSIMAREVSIEAPAVLTVGKMQAGVVPNAIADLAQIQGTLRAYDEATREQVKRRLCEMVKLISAAFRVRQSVRFDSGCPTLFNGEEVSNFVHSCAEETFGKNQVLFSAELGGKSGGGSEDFAYFSREVPSVMVGICAGESDCGFSYPLHHPKTNFDEGVLPIGAALLAQSALAWTGKIFNEKKST